MYFFVKINTFDYFDSARKNRRNALKRVLFGKVYFS